MYSQKIVDQSERRLRDKFQLKLVRYSADECHSRSAELAKLRSDDGSFSRALTPDEKSFIKNEQLLCAIDFVYFFERYASLIQDQGGLLTGVDLWESQRILLNVIANLEEAMHDAASHQATIDGILIYLHKARQLGATAIARAITVHRLISSKHVRAMAASVDDDKIMELYDRDKIIIDNLPFYLRPSLQYDEKAQHIFLDKLGSRCIYQVGSQKSGLGQGRQFDVSHLTECASWQWPGMIEVDFMPTIPQSLRAFCLLESTAQGRGNWWHTQIKKLQQHQVRRWNLVFIPWYVEKKKYHATPPANWEPSEEAMAHAQHVYETSHRYIGRSVMLTKDQLYWWQTTRDEHYLSNSLAIFYTNYCATIEESFQFTTKSAFSFDTIEYYRSRATNPTAYRIDTINA